MIAYLLRRLAASLLLLWLVLSLTFLLVHAAPGEPEQLLVPLGGQGGSAEQRQAIARSYGLDRPLPEQYLRWLGAALGGDWGTSFSKRRPAARMVVEALPATLLLAFAATLVEYALAVPFAILAARRRGSAFDVGTRTVSLVFFSLPEFWLGLMTIILVARWAPGWPLSDWMPPGAGPPTLGRLGDLARHLLLPAAVLGVASAGGTLRLLRNSLLDVLGQDYIRTARAKGLGERRVLAVHALRNAAVPAIQMLGVNLGSLLGGTLVVEVVFAWPGLGRLTFEAIRSNDYPVILAATTVGALVVIVCNLAADLAQAAADPRVRHR